MHFADAMYAELGAKRLWSEPKVYYFPGTDLYLMSCVNDILAVGLQDSTDWFDGELSQLLLIKQLGELQPSGKDIPFPWPLSRKWWA